jgi:iron complex outermembrane receptor protein
MNVRKQSAYLLTTSLIALFSAGAVQAQAPASASAPEEELEAIVVTGTRGAARTVQTSPVPIDVVQAEELKSVSSSDTLDVLKTIVPSYSVTRNVNSNTGTFIRPIAIRGLSEDKTLLLVNSKRRHKSASVASAGNGAQGSDAAVIPSIAIKSVEILRDGAAAQYGSDAIAGVVNFILKDSASGIELSAQTGQFYQGDGGQFILSANVGLPLLDRGFINLSAQAASDDRTSRSRQFTSAPFDAAAYNAANPTYKNFVDLSRPIQRHGQPDSEGLRTFVNMGYDLTDSVALYGFGNYSSSNARTDANYRYPGGGQPVLDTPIRLESGRVFRFNELFPGGYKPQFAGFVTDYSGTLGVKGDFFAGGGDATYDLSGRYGNSRIVYKVYNSMNASNGPAQALTKRDFTSLDFRSDEWALNADFSWTKDVGFASPLSISAGAEYRNEGYTIISTEKESYEAGIFANQDPFDFCTNETTVTARTLRPTAPQNQGIQCAVATDPVYRVMPAGANVFNGIPPAFAGEFRANSKSAYLEMATDITDKWFVDVATRFENFSTFGSILTAKVATRYELTEGLGIRASMGSGFHGPTPGLLNTTQVSVTSVEGVSQLGGVFPSTSPVAQFLGAKELGPERTVNFSAGITMAPSPKFNMTIDAYQIRITDQIYSTSNITVTPAIRTQLVAAGIVAGNSISTVRFFQNAFNSTTTGFDVVGTYRQNWGNGQITSIVGAFNYNNYTIEKLKIAGLFNDTSIFNFENGIQWRSVITATHDMGMFQGMIRANVFGGYTVQADVAPLFPRQRRGIVTQWDAELKYRINPHYTFTIGARNIFDKYPDPNVLNPGNGSIYSDSVVDFMGGFYFARFDVKY